MALRLGWEARWAASAGSGSVSLVLQSVSAGPWSAALQSVSAALQSVSAALRLALVESELEMAPQSGEAAAWRSAALVLEQVEFPLALRLRSSARPLEQTLATPWFQSFQQGCFQHRSE